MASGLKQRIITAIAIGIPILALLFYSTETRIVLIALLMFFTAIEYLKLSYDNSKKWLPAISLLATIGLIYLVKIDSIAIYFLGASLIFNLYLLIELYFLKGTSLTKNAWINSLFYTSIPLSLLIMEKNIDRIDILFPSILLMIWISDISAYFVGKSIGKRKLMLRISPGKSWEGFWGAGLVTILSSYIFFTIFNIYNVQVWALIGLSVWLFGSIGDLVESKFKRALGIKDSGTILPGHGGFLDRFDGFYFCIPFVLTVVFIADHFL